MVTAGDFKNGVTLEYDGNICQIIEFQHVKPGKGAAFVRTKFHLPQNGELVEPDVEIELDEYRSYNRSKRSGLQTSK